MYDTSRPTVLKKETSCFPRAQITITTPSPLMKMKLAAIMTMDQVMITLIDK